MQVRVYKFGGASLADIDKLKDVARFLKSEKKKHGDPVLAVVSAMGKTTDELISLAKKVSPNPHRRELDMLLTVGERTSMALMCLALHDLGETSVSFTGSQAGILTDTSHGNARIQAIRPFRVEDKLKEGGIVILAGFQGVSETTKEITTLGRGGTDTTAVSMASHFKSPQCEFKKDVGGIFSADPKLVPNAKHLPQLTHKNLADMTFWGAKVLHYRAAELAYTLNLPLRFSHFQNENEFTLVTGDVQMLEQQKVLAVNTHKDAHRLLFKKMSQLEVLDLMNKKIAETGIPYPQILSITTIEDVTKVLLVGEIGGMCTEFKWPCTSENLSTVTLTCQGAVSSELLFKTLKHITGIPVHQTLQDTTNITFVVNPKDREPLIKKLHELV